MRTTNDPKENGIRIRFNREMKEYLVKRSKEEQRTVSEIVREIVREEMDRDFVHQ